MIPYGRQEIRQEDLDAVAAVLRSEFLTQGPAVPRFESAVAARVGAMHALAVNSATSALHVACMALGLAAGDWLWTSPNTFVASANCALYCGAQVDFVDIDPSTYNLCPLQLERKLLRAEREGRLPKIVVAVHFAGQSCDMPAIGALARRFGFQVIEDASHAIGGSCDGEAVGSCLHSAITVFSFHPVKIVTTAEGGMAVTNDAALAARMALARSHGITRDPAQMVSEPEGAWYYQQVGLGYNYRLTDLQAALGLTQLARLEEYVARRHEIAARYDAALAPLAVATPWRDPRHRSAMHLYVVRLPGADAARRRRVFDALRAGGIGVNVHYLPVYSHPYYARMGFEPREFPVAEQYYREALSLPMFPTLTGEQQDEVVRQLGRALAS